MKAVIRHDGAMERSVARDYRLETFTSLYRRIMKFTICVVTGAGCGGGD